MKNGHHSMDERASLALAMAIGRAAKAAFVIQCVRIPYQGLPCINFRGCRAASVFPMANSAPGIHNYF